MTRSILITGCAGFIGSHLTRLLVKNHPDWLIVGYDYETYAADLGNLSEAISARNFLYVQGDIKDSHLVRSTMVKFSITDVLHLAAESHVDNSILTPSIFAETNVMGTLNLLNIAKNLWSDPKEHKFIQVSTDEVYGSLEIGDDRFNEHYDFQPNSPYSASKAAADLFARAYHKTYGFPVIITHCSNNFGPCQNVEKLIPTVVHRLKNYREVPIYGNGTNIRDWLYVEDHCKALELILEKGRVGETYCIGGDTELTNIEIINAICEYIDQKYNRPEGTSKGLCTFVKDRPGHDTRYGIDHTKLTTELGWFSNPDGFLENLHKTVDYYWEAYGDSGIEG